MGCIAVRTAHANPATCIDERPIRIFAARYPTQAAENITLFVSE